MDLSSKTAAGRSLGKAQLREKTLGKPMNWLFSELSCQGIAFQPTLSDWSGGSTETSARQPLPLPGASCGGQGLRVSNQDPWDDPDSSEVNQPKAGRGGCEGRDFVEAEAQIMFQTPSPSSPPTAMATPPLSSLP